MSILLNDGYFIDMDNLNYTLKRKTKERRKDGQEHDVERTMGYFGSLESAVERFVEETNKNPDEAMSLKQYAERVERSNKETTAQLVNRIREENMDEGQKD